VSDLTADEQKHVRAALRFLRAKCGTWRTTAKALHLGLSTVGNVAAGTTSASPLMAFRVAKVAGVGVDEVLTGAFPPAGTCPHCGAQMNVT